MQRNVFWCAALGKKSSTDRLHIRLPKPSGMLVSASGTSQSQERKCFSKTNFLPSDPDELCDRLNLLLQKKNKLLIFRT